MTWWVERGYVKSGPHNVRCNRCYLAYARGKQRARAERARVAPATPGPMPVDNIAADADQHSERW